MSEAHTEELFARLRETEAQTREQNVKLDALANQVEKLSETNREYISLLREQMDKADKREQFLMRTIYILVGALIVLALGMKYAEKIMSPQMAIGDTQTRRYIA